MTFQPVRAALCALAMTLTFATGLTASTAAVAQDDPPVADLSAADPAPDLAQGNQNAPGDVPAETYSKEETLAAAEKFFGGTTSGLAKAIEKAFSELGRPVGYIVGTEGSGAFIVGLRYGEGMLNYKGGGSTQVYWQGPSVGWDAGGNASKVFTLVYNLRWTKDLYQRFPGVDGSLYLVAGVGLNYQRANDITLAPIRTGVGLRAGASIGYLSYTREKRINPF